MAVEGLTYQKMQLESFRFFGCGGGAGGGVLEITTTYTAKTGKGNPVRVGPSTISRIQDLISSSRGYSGVPVQGLQGRREEYVQPMCTNCTPPRAGYNSDPK